MSREAVVWGAAWEMGAGGAVRKRGPSLWPDARRPLCLRGRWRGLVYMVWCGVLESLLGWSRWWRRRYVPWDMLCNLGSLEKLSWDATDIPPCPSSPMNRLRTKPLLYRLSASLHYRQRIQSLLPTSAQRHTQLTLSSLPGRQWSQPSVAHVEPPGAMWKSSAHHAGSLGDRSTGTNSTVVSHYGQARVCPHANTRTCAHTPRHSQITSGRHRVTSRCCSHRSCLDGPPPWLLIPQNVLFFLTAALNELAWEIVFWLRSHSSEKTPSENAVKCIRHTASPEFLLSDTDLGLKGLEGGPTPFVIKKTWSPQVWGDWHFLFTLSNTERQH